MSGPLSKSLSKSYEPQGFESRIYSEWEKAGLFESKEQSAPGQEAFSIVIPPPNVTGVLHMGHALTNAIQDTLVRWRRMRGDNTLWLPGTDHAGIATQAQVEKQIAKEGKGPTGKPLSRHDLGREKFLERTWKWKADHESQIKNQLKRLGSSLDWKRERFTMDEGLSKAVREVFVRLYEDKLIYRGERIINWCPRCQTALSDLEVIPTERKGSFWHLKYVVLDAHQKPTGESLIIATTRPETLLGDTAVAVHPDDERYTHLHGKQVQLPLINRALPIITDTYVDKEFGSGALKITPAHDFNDYDLGLKHKLPIISVMGKDGKITADGGPYAGLKYADARTQILADLEAQGLLVKTEPHTLKVGLCQRCDNVAEPIVSKQWFVKIEPLAKPAIEAVKDGRITFTPVNWEKTYFEWMYNIRDWCISRQLWWGHQIPAWHCSKCEGITVARETPPKCLECGAPSTQLVQDPDVLDTWFSSALWPFSTLGWPDKTPALATFYPTSILETGFDILFFWVARMIMMGMHFMGDVPFRKVYLHAMVRDEKGEKMSKSKGNVIDPLTLIDQHGADPLRFTLIAMAGQGRDIKLSVDRVEGYRAFCNKFWNATKFFHLQFDPEFLKSQHPEGEPELIPAPPEGVAKWLATHHAGLLGPNRWILSRLQAVTARVEKGFAAFELNDSAMALYEFTWHEFCDWYIEFAKLPLREGAAQRKQTLYTIHHVLDTVCKLLHPIMPFVTEELWHSLPWTVQARPGALVKTLMLQPFPDVEPKFRDEDAERTIDALKSVVEVLRNFRGENNLSPKAELHFKYRAQTPAAEAFLRMVEPEILALARIASLSAETSPLKDPVAVIPMSNPPVELRISLEGLIDIAAETQRLKKEIDKLQAEWARVDEKLSRETFVAKAPPELVEAERRKRDDYAAQKKDLEAALVKLTAKPGASS